MSEKSGSPLNNPPPTRNVADDVVVKNINPTTTTAASTGRGGPKGGEKGRAIAVGAIVKCQMCGREQKLVFRYGTPPEWHKCTWCGELQPADGYRVIAYGLGLPTPLAPHEVKAREAGLGY